MAGSPAAQVATSQMRAKIPTEWAMELMDWSLEALRSLASDVMVKREIRAYAGWEFDFRAAFDVADEEDPVLAAWRETQAAAPAPKGKRSWADKY